MSFSSNRYRGNDVLFHTLVCGICNMFSFFVSPFTGEIFPLDVCCVWSFFVVSASYVAVLAGFSVYGCSEYEAEFIHSFSSSDKSYALNPSLKQRQANDSCSSFMFVPLVCCGVRRVHLLCTICSVFLLDSSIPSIRLYSWFIPFYVIIRIRIDVDDFVFFLRVEP